jgi:hypothetical protein
MAHRPVRRWMLDRLGVFRGAKGRAAAAEPRCRGWPPVPMAVREECDQLGVSYYDTLLPIREPGPGLRDAMAGLRLPYRALASIVVPAGRVVVAFVSDSAQLSRLFAANWAQAGTGQDGLRLRLLSAGQNLCAGHLFRRERGRHIVLARMRIVSRRGDRSAGSCHHREFRGREDHTRRGAAAS